MLSHLSQKARWMGHPAALRRTQENRQQQKQRQLQALADEHCAFPPIAKNAMDGAPGCVAEDTREQATTTTTADSSAQDDDIF
ncbi:hypothetical protein HDF10_003265 [Edaphobacter lichenicola]|uniref:Uncharacterized protein n=1 Tax=Tunturiibacter lichenicola TaxID=2051959 RepID=A0A7W8N4J3_9BACT|nr:hypothetical protein [Edaphobacter lichenicola]